LHQHLVLQLLGPATLLLLLLLPTLQLLHLRPGVLQGPPQQRLDMICCLEPALHQQQGQQCWLLQLEQLLPLL
jgi:hypothetical protein